MYSDMYVKGYLSSRKIVSKFNMKVTYRKIIAL